MSEYRPPFVYFGGKQIVADVIKERPMILCPACDAEMPQLGECPECDHVDYADETLCDCDYCWERYHDDQAVGPIDTAG